LVLGVILIDEVLEIRSWRRIAERKVWNWREFILPGLARGINSSSEKELEF
jgi:hypothetical protein